MSNAVLRPLPPPDDADPPLWAGVMSQLTPPARRLVLDRLVTLNREAAAARAEADRLAPPPSRADRIRSRDNAIRAALAAFYGDVPPSAGAKTLARELDRYASGAWARGERSMAELPEGASDLRRRLHHILRLNDGRALGWRRLLQLSE